MKNTLKKAIACIPLVTLLTGCNARASANVIFNSNSTFSIEELVLLPNVDGELVDYDSEYYTLSPLATFEYKTSEFQEENISGTHYSGYHTETYDMTVSDYSEYLTANTTKDYAFKPTIAIEGSGIRKKATLTCENYFSSGSQQVDLDGASLKVNVTVPASVVDGSVTSNATSVSEDETIYTWENEDIDNMTISFEYTDLSGPIGVATATIAIAITAAIIAAMTDFMTKPRDPKKATYKV